MLLAVGVVLHSMILCCRTIGSDCMIPSVEWHTGLDLVVSCRRLESDIPTTFAAGDRGKEEEASERKPDKARPPC